MRFSDIIGHEEAKTFLRGLADSGKIPHALLISGHEGIGKLQLARAFAQYLHCDDRRNGDSCGKCPACIQHRTNNFPDLIFSYPTISEKGKTQTVSEDFSKQWAYFLSEYPLASYRNWLEILGSDNSQPIIRVSESEAVIHKLSLSNYQASQKILIVWLPEKLQPAAANKLLKLIEEPDEGNIIILVSNFPEEILPTIFSRVQRINLRPLPADIISEYLKKEYSLDSKEAENIARISEGNIGKAIEVLQLREEEVIFREMFQTLMRKSYAADIDGLKEWSEKAAAFKREKSKRFISYCSRILRENFIYNFHLTDINFLAPEDENFSRKFSPFINIHNVNKILSEFNDADRDISGNGNARIIFFDLALQMTILIKIQKQSL